jgi:hypothetical protein
MNVRAENRPSPRGLSDAGRCGQPSKPSPVEHRCEALTIGDIPPYRCTTSATADRRGRAVCASHARALRIRWFDERPGLIFGM